MLSSREKYSKRKMQYERLLTKQTRIANLISNLRLAVFVLGLTLGIVLYVKGVRGFSVGVWALTLLVFIYLAVRHHKILANKKTVLSLIQINTDALMRLDGEWSSFPDNGEDFRAEDHPYADDLDIFGRSSLFQWINTAQTYLGRIKLKEALAEAPDSVNEIRKRQETILELASALTWRQRFNTEGLLLLGKMNPEPLFKWAETRNSFYLSQTLMVLVRLFPALTILLIILYYVTSVIPAFWPVSGFALQALALFIGKERGQALATVYGYERSLKTYYQMLKRFELKHYQAKLLQEYQSGLKGRSKHPAFKQLEQLSKIVDAISNRNNAIFLLINILTLWDYQCMIALENWKKDSGRLLKRWLTTIGEVEALSSLAIIAHDHPDWGVPQIQEGQPFLVARSLGHPLLTQGCVRNDLTIKKPAGILLITGSNMSGKSTLLRTAGINLVLAYAGASVCAENFSYAPMQIYTCMRVSDNLEKSISSFYAEILRIKKIVEFAQKSNGQIFFLLDEIFKGTNSQDRHIGAKTLVMQLGKLGAIGMVSTHDLELGELERDSNGKIRNYHFREYYQNDKIQFDYKLRPGIATTRNALYLIKLAGIDIEGKVD